MAGRGRGRPPISTTKSTASVGTPSVGNPGVGTPSVGNPSVGTTVRGRTLRKNAPGQRQDIGWAHCTLIKGNKVKCKYCHKVMASGGIYRLKHHLACTKKDVEECRAVPDNVQEQMWNIVVDMQKKLIDKRTPPQSDEVEVAEVDLRDVWKRKRVEVSQPSVSNIFKKGITSQPTINNVFKQKEKEGATSVVPVDELDVVDDGGNDGDDGGDYGEGYVGDDYVGDDYLGDAYGAYDINDEIKEDEDEDIMGDVPNINMNDLI